MRSSRTLVLTRGLSTLILAGVWFGACAAPDTGGAGADSGGDGDTDEPTSTTEGVDSGIDPTTEVDTSDSGIDPTGPPTATCADGIRDEDEACDDGNSDDGDGCPSNCRFIEEGFICPKEGELCRPFVRCGDGRVGASEQCDGGPEHDVTGCSDNCQVEAGYKCDVDEDGVTTCEETVCGDGVAEGAEPCDDGNLVPFDGCSPSCAAEPSCTTSGCSSDCGDGLVIAPEQCDDGNLLDGDGCSANCQEEDGFLCETKIADCDKVGDECVLSLPIIYRDFPNSHPDFENPAGNCSGALTGVVEPTLTDGKPKLASGAGACIESASTFSDWYRDVASNSQIIDQKIVLFPDASGGYVNRTNNEGDRFYANQKYTANVVCEGAGCCTSSADPNNCCELSDSCQPCTTTNIGQACSGTWMDGNPTFFPIEEHPDALTVDAPVKAYIPPPYGNWSEAGEFVFSFTSEITYWFQYDESKAYTLSFLGDDDVWVFLNGRLVVELAGVHAPVEGSFTIPAGGGLTSDSNGTNTTPQDLALEDGKVYEIKVFQAERNPTASSFKLTLSGFEAGRSVCTAMCGDGIIAGQEMCDEGENNSPEGESAHNKCAHDCTLGAYCGDGIRQEEEDCDDNDMSDPNRDDCQGCQYIVIR